MCVCHLQGLAALKTSSSSQQKSASSAQPMSKTLGTLQSKHADKVAYFKYDTEVTSFLQG